MGMFFENYHIKMSDGDNQKKLNEAIESAFAKQGYVNCDDESATKSLVLRTSETGKWMSMIFAEENDGEVDRNFCFDVYFKVLEQLKASGLIANCVDSDFAMLRLVSIDEDIDSAITIGDSYTGEVTKKEALRDWESVVDTKKLYEVCCEDYTFAEEGLEKAAELLGLDKNQVFLTEDDTSDESLTTLYFKKKNQRRKSFKTLFLEIFEEGLKDEGFVRVKGKYPYLARMVSEEVYQVITYKDEWCAETYQPQTRGCKAFTIMGTFRSIYSELFDFDDSPRNNAVVLDEIRAFQLFSGHINCYYESNYNYFLFYPNDEKSVISTIENALNATKEEIIEPYAYVKNLKECLLLNETLSFQNQYAPKYDEEKKKIVEISPEGVVYIILNERDDFLDYIDDYIMRFKEASKVELTPESCLIDRVNRFRSNMLYNVNAKEELKQYGKLYLEFSRKVKIRKEKNREALKRMNIMY